MEQRIVNDSGKSFDAISNLPDLLGYFRGHFKKYRVKSEDIDFFLINETANLLGKSGGFDTPETIDQIKGNRDVLLQNIKRAIWAGAKRKQKEVTYGKDPEHLLNRLHQKETGRKPPRSSGDNQWDLKIKTRVRMPSDSPGLSLKIRYLPKESLVEEMLEEFDWLDEKEMGMLNDPILKQTIDKEGGEHTAAIFKIILKYRPVKISAKAISEKLDIPQRTVERRLSWIKNNEKRIHELTGRTN